MNKKKHKQRQVNALRNEIYIHALVTLKQRWPLITRLRWGFKKYEVTILALLFTGSGMVLEYFYNITGLVVGLL